MRDSTNWLKPLCLLLLMAGSVGTYASESLLASAKEVATKSDLQRLVESSFGGGEYFRAGQSNYYVAVLQPTSGILVNEVYIFEAREDGLTLKASIPGRFQTARKAGFVDNHVVVSERGQNDDWTVILRFSAKD